MKINFDNVHIDDEFREEAFLKFDDFRRHLLDVRGRGDYSNETSSINLPLDTDLHLEVKELAQEKAGGVKMTIVIGIGGSSLGAEAVYKALGGGYGALGVETIFIETVDSRMLEKLRETILTLKSPSEVLVCVVSKSGHTTEVVANADIIYQTLTQRFGEEAKDRVVVISDRDSDLSRIAESEGFGSLYLPQAVGGRYSVFSPVGLFPLLISGVDIEGFALGASEMLNRTLGTEDNPAVLSATALAYHYKQNRKIHDTFVFDPSFESLGKWYRQLLGESIGKTNPETGERVGITPTVSVGSTDLHSVGQLYFGGPQDERFTTFIRRSWGRELGVSSYGVFSGLVRDLDGRSSEEILDSLALGAEEAYRDAGLPFVDVLFEGVNPRELGAFMQWKMIEVMFLAQLLEVNAFDQPAVESYKEKARRILSE